MKQEPVSEKVDRAIDVTDTPVAEGHVQAALSSVRSLARVLSPERPLVMLINRDRQQVTFATAEMLDLLGRPQMPLAIDEAVGRLPLVDHHDETLGVSLHPVTTVARGEAVTGLEARTSPNGASRRYWINGFDIEHLPDDEPDALGVVVLMPIDQDAVSVSRLSSEAIGATDLSFSISDHTVDDDPLCYVNPAFEALTGYRTAEVIGRNCRFLQGPDTDPEAVETLRDAVDTESAAVVTLLNYRADGSTFWNEVTISPVRDGDRVTHFVGIQRDVTEHVRIKMDHLASEGLRQQLHAEAELARGEAEEEQERAERANARLRFLDHAGRILNANLSREELGERLIDLLASVGDHAAVAVGDSEVTGPDLTVSSDGPHGTRLKQLAWEWAWADSPPEAVGADTDADHVFAEALAETGLGHLEFACLEIGGSTLGGVVVGWDRPGEASASKRRLLEQVLARATPAFLAAKRLREQGTIAEALQRFLRPPELPHIEHYEIAGRYEPAGSGVEVGGDFYDVVRGSDAWIVVLGDVCGKGPDAAAVTGIVRSTVRALAPYVDSPTEMLRGLHRAVYQQVPDDRFVTAVCAYIRFNGKSSRISLAVGGHARPVLIRHGMSRQVGVPGQLLGVLEDVELTGTDIIMEPGNTLVMMTDGVLETPASYEISRVMQVASQAVASADETATAVMDVMGSLGRDVHSRDDAAVLALRYVG